MARYELKSKNISKELHNKLLHNRQKQSDFSAHVGQIQEEHWFNGVILDFIKSGITP